MNTEKLVAFLRRILRRKSSAQMAIAPSLADQTTLTMVAATRDQEIGCDEAYAFLDSYTDHISRGEDAAVLMPLVHHHLKMCPDCREEFNTLLLAMEATSQ